MALEDLIVATFNYLSLAVFVGLVTLAGFRMVWRLGNFWFFKVPTPVLLKRDIVMFGALGFYFGTALLALLFGAVGLAHVAWWVIPRGLTVLAAMAYWVKVEYGLDNGDKG